MDAGNMATAVPRNMLAMGVVANSGREERWLPAKPPTVITSTETVWNKAWAMARMSTWRCMDCLNIAGPGLGSGGRLPEVAVATIKEWKYWN